KINKVAKINWLDVIVSRSQGQRSFSIKGRGAHDYGLRPPDAYDGHGAGLAKLAGPANWFMALHGMLCAQSVPIRGFCRPPHRGYREGNCRQLLAPNFLRRCVRLAFAARPGETFDRG